MLTHLSGLGSKVLADDPKILDFLYLPPPSTIPSISHSRIKVDTLNEELTSMSVFN